MRKVWRENGLSIVLFALFAVLLAGQSYVGLLRENDELLEHAQSPVSWTEYVTSGGFLEATMENWESEFLQMWAYVIFTVFLFQKGSSESKPPDEDHPVNRDPRAAKDKRTRLGLCGRVDYRCGCTRSLSAPHSSCCSPSHSHCTQSGARGTTTRFARSMANRS